jgi:hypothetical protein
MRVMAIVAVTLLLVGGAAAQYTVTVDGVGAGVGEFATLSAAVADVQANSSPPNIINVTADALDDNTQIVITTPMTINGDADGNSISADILVDFNTTTGIGAEAATGAGLASPEVKEYIELAVDGAVVISDLRLHPSEGGNTGSKLIDAVGFYRPASGTGEYTLNNIEASCSSSSVYQDPLTGDDVYYASGAARWYAYTSSRGIFNLRDDGGAGDYNATLNNCVAGAARQYNLNIMHTTGTNTINDGVYACAGVDNINVTGTAIFTGSETDRVRAYLGNRSSGGTGITIGPGAVVDMSWVDVANTTPINGNTGSHISLEGDASVTMQYVRAGNFNPPATWGGSALRIAVSAELTANDSTFHAGSETGDASNCPNPVVIAASHVTGNVDFTDCIFTSADDPGGVVLLDGSSAYTLDYCALPTDSASPEALLTANPVSGTATVTNSVSVSPNYWTTSFDVGDPDNISYLRPNNEANYNAADSGGGPLTGGAGGSSVPVGISILRED